VSKIGEVLVAGFGSLLNKSVFQTMPNINAAYNFFGPIAGMQFVITSIIADGPASATVSIYEAASTSTITMDKLIYTIDFRVAGNLVIPFPFGGFLPVSEGEYLNAFTDGATVNMTIVGYYHPTIRSSLVS
jgi:hypothetical protein